MPHFFSMTERGEKNQSSLTNRLPRLRRASIISAFQISCKPHPMLQGTPFATTPTRLTFQVPFGDCELGCISAE